MKSDRSLDYGRKLVHASASGIRQAQQSGVDGHSSSAVLIDSARNSLLLAAACACATLLPSSMTRRDGRFTRAVTFGALGSALGFFAGFVWNTRKLTSSMAHSAYREVQKVRDEHWLEVNPIDYA